MGAILGIIGAAFLIFAAIDIRPTGGIWNILFGENELYRKIQRISTALAGVIFIIWGLSVQFS